MKTLKNYLQEASLLDIEGTIEGGEEAIKDKIERWIKDNFKVDGLKISDNPNSDGKYEVRAVNVDVTNKNITSLTNGLFVWKTVYTFDCSYCKNLISLEGAPEKVGGSFDCHSCNSLKSIEGAPKEVVNFICSYCDSLTSLKSAPSKVGEDFYCSNCKSLKTIDLPATTTIKGKIIS